MEPRADYITDNEPTPLYLNPDDERTLRDFVRQVRTIGYGEIHLVFGERRLKRIVMVQSSVASEKDAKTVGNT